MGTSKYSAEKCSQILVNVENWTHDCRKHPDYKRLSKDAKKNFCDITRLFAETMYSYHHQSPEQWTETALHNTLIEIYPNKLVVDTSYCRLTESVLTVFFKYLQGIGVITPDKARMLDEQLKSAMPELLSTVEDLDVVNIAEQLLEGVSNLGPDVDDIAELDDLDAPEDSVNNRLDSLYSKKLGRNEPCPCGSGKKYKKCCFLNSFDAVEGSQRSKHRLARTSEPSIDQWAKLYDIAGAVQRFGPWKVLQEAHFVTLMLPGRKEPVYCSAIGYSGSWHGIAIYPGYQAIGAFFQLVESSQDKFNFLSAVEQDILLCHFGNCDALAPNDREIHKKLNLNFSEPNECIYFRSRIPGYAEWRLNSEQAALLTQVLQHFLMACTYLSDNKLSVNLDNGETLLHKYSPKKKLWLNTIEEFSPITVITKELHTPNEKLAARLKKIKCNNQKLEFEAGHLPVPIIDEDDDRPYFPNFMMLVDKESGSPIDQHLEYTDAPLDAGIFAMLVAYMLLFGRPHSINVRDERAGHHIADFCKKTGVELIVNKGVPAVDNLIECLLNSTDANLAVAWDNLFWADDLDDDADTEAEDI